MNTDSILNSIRYNESLLRQNGVSSVGIFGSYSRNAAKENSDLDILIDFEAKRYTYDNFIATCDILQGLFVEKKLDIVTKKSLSAYIGPEILKTVKYVF